MYYTLHNVLLLTFWNVKHALCKEKFRIVCNCSMQHASQNKTSIMGLCGPDDQNDQRYYTLSSVTCAVCSVLCAMCSVKYVECAVGYIVYTKGKKKSKMDSYEYWNFRDILRWNFCIKCILDVQNETKKLANSVTHEATYKKNETKSTHQIYY